MDDKTRLVTAGRPAGDGLHYVNPPVQRASTVLFPSMAALRGPRDPIRQTGYARYGTTTSFAFEDACAAIDGADGALALPSGKAAINLTLAALLDPGDHLLMCDHVYGPTRDFCDGYLSRIGVETTYYDPLLGAGIAELLRPNTKLVFTESPGSQTFEVMDLPAISGVARQRGALVLLDNTWATGLLFKPFDHGADICLQAATKYLVGHSDAMLGVVTWKGDIGEKLVSRVNEFGAPAAPDDCYLGLRGLRSMSARLAQHEAHAFEIAKWIQDRPEVERVLHPALPDCPGHALFKRDFLGSSGLFGVVLRPVAVESVAAMLDGLRLFGMGFSWGGFESLIIPAKAKRTVTPWPLRTTDGPLLRLHIGLEHTADLKADLDAGFARLRAAARP